MVINNLIDRGNKYFVVILVILLKIVNVGLCFEIMLFLRFFLLGVYNF